MSTQSANQDHKRKPNIDQIIIKALLKSAPKPGQWISVQTWTDAANIVATTKLDGVPFFSVAVAKILRGLKFEEMRGTNGYLKFAVTRAGLKALERASDGK